MSNQTTLNLNDVILGSFAKYNSHFDYNQGDWILNLIEENGEVVGRKQGLIAMFQSVANLSSGAMRSQTFSFLDLLLVKNSDFIAKYLEWLLKLVALNNRVYQLEQIAKYGCPMKLHDGIVVHSATADTENKIKAQFGGVSWKRVMNFPFLVKDSAVNEVGNRSGESYVSLVLNNLKNHRHELTRIDSDGDTWKTNNNPGPSKFLQSTCPGLLFGEKNVYPEISPLNWCDDYSKGTNSSSGTARYVKPHFNIPPYKDVYIWVCEKKADDNIAGIEVPMGAPPTVAQIRSMLEDPSFMLRDDNIPQDATFSEIKDLSTNATYKNIFNISTLAGLTNSDLANWFIFVSDDLMLDKVNRYESKDANVVDLGDYSSWFVWSKTLNIEKRYLFRETYKYLIEDIQDRIYLLLKRLDAAMKALENVPERLQPGQYVFFYPSNMDTDENKGNYKLPEGYHLQRVSNVFLRGTSMFTEETRSLFGKYNLRSKAQGEDPEAAISTEGGLRDVSLNGMNFPKHLHWSMILSKMSSLEATRDEDAGHKTGNTGSDLYMNDPRSGGLMHGASNGTGPYQFSTKSFGSAADIVHNNIPNYLTMSVYVVCN